LPNSQAYHNLLRRGINNIRLASLTLATGKAYDLNLLRKIVDIELYLASSARWPQIIA